MIENAPSLPSSHAFIVQFRGPAGNEPRGRDGRVEHVASGQSRRFESWRQLREFVEQVLAELSETRRA